MTSSLGPNDSGRVIARILAAYQRTLQERRLSPNTQRAYTSRASAYLHWQAEQPATDTWTSPAAVQSYSDSLAAAGRTTWTVNANLTAVQDLIRSVGGTAVVHRTTPRMRSHILTATEQDALTAALPRLKTRDKLLILLLWDLASTPAEASALHDRDIYPTDDARTSVQQSVVTGRRLGLRIADLDLLIPPRLSDVIAEHLDEAITPGFLLASDTRNGTHQLSKLSITKVVAAVGQRAGIHDLSARALRRTALAAVITNPDSELSAFELGSRVHPKHARQIRRSVLRQLAEQERSLMPGESRWADQPPQVATFEEFEHQAAAAMSSSWMEIMNAAHPERGHDVEFSPQQSLKELLQQTLMPALLADTPTHTPAGFRDHLSRFCLAYRPRLVQIYRRYLAAQPLLRVPASLGVLLLTRPEREPLGSDHGIPGLFADPVRQAVSELAVINFNPDLGSEAWQLWPAR